MESLDTKQTASGESAFGSTNIPDAANGQQALDTRIESILTPIKCVDNLPDTASPVVLTPPQTTRRSRGANAAYDTSWTRHHAICTMAVICDLELGGFAAARVVAEPLKQGIRPSTVPARLLKACPWVLKPDYLNFECSAALTKYGIQKCFHSWASNRVYYFYRYPERSEHPVKRVRCNIRDVYRQFYDTFSADVAAGMLISEERARAFWESVADRVPFNEPAQGAFAGVPAAEPQVQNDATVNRPPLTESVDVNAQAAQADLGVTQESLPPNS